MLKSLRPHCTPGTLESLKMTEGALRWFCKCFRPTVQKLLNNDQFLSKEIEPDQN
jgi:hypothetical protein